MAHTASILYTHREITNKCIPTHTPATLPPTPTPTHTHTLHTHAHTGDRVLLHGFSSNRTKTLPHPPWYGTKYLFALPRVSNEGTWSTTCAKCYTPHARGYTPMPKRLTYHLLVFSSIRHDCTVQVSLNLDALFPNRFTFLKAAINY